MPLKKIILSGIFFLGFTINQFAQNIITNPRWLHGFWTAKWIAHPIASGNDFGVYHFRKSFVLNERPGSFVVHVSADNRYRLFINGKNVTTVLRAVTLLLEF